MKLVLRENEDYRELFKEHIEDEPTKQSMKQQTATGGMSQE